ncbi:MAG TPA: DUF937 domain-containing protein [Pseudolysinimonas sp.]|nr:DUF937 domain-containing protein [Pseudolysinimonas sp.]
MADLNALLDQIPVDDIARQLGIDEDVARAAVQQVLPGLVGGLAANANDAKGQTTLTNVLKHHNKGIAKSVKEVDTEDGEKIVRNVFGPNTDAVATKLASASTKSDVTGDIIKQVLPIVAPIVLSWLASQFLGGKTDAATAAPAPAAPEPQASSGGGIGDLLGGLLSSPQGQQIAGELLGGLLGAGKK